MTNTVTRPIFKSIKVSEIPKYYGTSNPYKIWLFFIEIMNGNDLTVEEFESLMLKSLVKPLQEKH